MNVPMIDQVMTQVTAAKGDWPKIAKATGLKYDWLTRFAQGRIPDPSVRKIQVLYDYFHTIKASSEAA